jgi:triacylglycerol lipase
MYYWALMKAELGSASHGDNLEYEKYSPKVVSTSAAQADVVGVLHACVTSSIVTGDPNAVRGRWGSRPQWEPYERNNRKLMVFGDGNEERIGGGVGAAARFAEDEWAETESDFWWEKTEISE